MYKLICMIRYIVYIDSINLIRIIYKFHGVKYIKNCILEPSWNYLPSNKNSILLLSVYFLWSPFSSSRNLDNTFTSNNCSNVTSILIVS